MSTSTIQERLPLILKVLIPVLTKRIKAYHEQFSLPLVGEYWEETLHRSFTDIGETTSWKPDRSHTIGKDMTLEGIDNSRISCKSGQFIKKDRALGKKCVKFNGGRSTSHPTLEEKIAHFSESHDDLYFLLAKDKKFEKKYKLLVFASPVCKVNKLTWSESPSGKVWNGIGEFKAIIGKSMSHQLWTTLPLNMIEYQYDIDCSEYSV